MPQSFNLIDETWIPIISLDGTPRDVGLLDALARAHEWREIFDNSPLVTVALHRLLLAILYRASGAMTLEEWAETWEQFWHAGRFPEELINNYLERWRDRFDLFNEAYPFYQTARLGIASATKGDSASSIARLAPEWASGNNATLFNHHTDDDLTGVPAAVAARLLLLAQSFSMGGGISGTAQLGGRDFKRPNAQHAELVSGLTAWFEGDTLFRTLLLNLAPHDLEPDDLPPWELPQMDGHIIMQRAVDSQSRGYIDLLTWQSRLIRLCPVETNGTVTVGRAYITQGRAAGDIGTVFDPMKAYLRDEKRGYYPLRLSSDKASWCDSHALLALQPTTGKRPDAFNHVAEMAHLVPAESRYRLHVVGIVNDQAKVILWRHDRLPVGMALLRHPDQVERFGLIRKEADRIGFSLRLRTLRMAMYYVAPHLEEIDQTVIQKLLSPKPRETDIVEAQLVAASIDPCPAYWTRLEEPFYQLLDEFSVDMDSATAHWREAVEREAKRAFQEACCALGTSARALRAIARVSMSFKITQKDEEEVIV